MKKQRVTRDGGVRDKYVPRWERRMIKGRPSQQAAVRSASLPPPAQSSAGSAWRTRWRAYPPLRCPSRIFDRCAARKERASLTAILATGIC